MGFLSKRFNNSEIVSINKKLKNYDVSNTKLVILQDSTDRLLTLKGDILNEIQGNKKADNRDVKIARLEQKIAETYFDDTSIYKESKILFPTIEKFSIANHDFIMQKDSVYKEVWLLFQVKNRFKQTKKRSWKNGTAVEIETHSGLSRIIGS